MHREGLARRKVIVNATSVQFKKTLASIHLTEDIK